MGSVARSIFLKEKSASYSGWLPLYSTSFEALKSFSVTKKTRNNFNALTDLLIFPGTVNNSLCVRLHKRDPSLAKLSHRRGLAHCAAAVCANAAAFRLANRKAAASLKNVTGKRTPAPLSAVGMLSGDLVAGGVCTAAGPRPRDAAARDRAHQAGQSTCYLKRA